MDFVLHVAGAGQSLVFQDFGQDGLVDGDPSDFALSVVGILDFKKTVVGDIERGAVLVAGVEGGVAVSFAKLFDVGLSAENGSDDEFVERVKWYAEKITPENISRFIAAAEKTPEILEEANELIQVLNKEVDFWNKKRKALGL